MTWNSEEYGLAETLMIRQMATYLDKETERYAGREGVVVDHRCEKGRTTGLCVIRP